MDNQKLQEIELIAERIWKLADNLPVGKRTASIKINAEVIRELVWSIKDTE